MDDSFDRIYKTGITEIDDQHKLLFDSIKLLKDKNDRQSYLVLIMAIEVYILTHFETEEGIMIEHKYPFYFLHKKKHEEFLKKYQKIRELFTKEQLSDNFIENLSSLLENWIVEHYCRTDIDLINFLKDKKIA